MNNEHETNADQDAQRFYERWIYERSCEKSGHNWEVMVTFGGKHQVTCTKCGYWYVPGEKEATS